MTGKAAYPIGGATAHSAFLLGRAKKGRPTPAFSEKETRRLVDGLHGVEYVLIDEASMCGTVSLEELERNLRAERKSDDPKRKLWFGGFRVVFDGDFAQCPPIKSGAVMIDHQWFRLFEMVNLVQVHRQRDPDFLNILQAIRNRKMTHSPAQ